MRPDPGRFREVLGQYPTGVAVVTAIAADGRPVGMTVGSFTSVSLDPPLVAFMPDRSSSTWADIRGTGRFCVNVLGAHQEPVCRNLAAKGRPKFDGVSWRLSAGGSPVLEGVVAYIDCTVDAVHEAGDHDIVIGSVQELDIVEASSPLLFFQGGYGAFTPLSRASADADLLDRLRLVDLVRPHMERLSAALRTECTAITLVGKELVLTAAAGRAETSSAPTRVGQRVPFIPPLGSVFAAWGGEPMLDRWVDALGPAASGDERDRCRRTAALIRERGYALALGHRRSARVEEVSARLRTGDPAVTRAALADALADVRDDYNPATLEAEQNEFRYVSAPVFDRNGSVAITLTVWGPPGLSSRATVQDHARELVTVAAEASAALRTLTS